MLMMFLAATTATVEVPPQRVDPARCRAGVTLVSKTIEPQSAGGELGLIRKNKPDARGPAVLTPECKPERDKKKDYPLA